MRNALLSLVLPLLALAAQAQEPAPPAGRLEAVFRPDVTELTRGEDIIWVEWLERGDRGGSYLRSLGGWTLGVNDPSFLIGAGTKFVFKAPDTPARVYLADRAITISQYKRDLTSIAEVVQSQARFLNEAVTPWTGEIALHYGNRTEIKKDWTDGELVEVDWASGRGNDDGRAFLRVVNGRMAPTTDGVMGMGARYKITAGTVFNIKVPHVPVQRQSAARDFWIAKNGAPSLGEIQIFFAK